MPLEEPGSCSTWLDFSLLKLTCENKIYKLSHHLILLIFYDSNRQLNQTTDKNKFTNRVLLGELLVCIPYL